jgi:hypothetical protein
LENPTPVGNGVGKSSLSFTGLLLESCSGAADKNCDLQVLVWSSWSYLRHHFCFVVCKAKKSITPCKRISARKHPTQAFYASLPHHGITPVQLDRAGIPQVAR